LNKRELAHELRRYIHAQQGLAPPGAPEVSTKDSPSESSDTGVNRDDSTSTVPRPPEEEVQQRNSNVEPDDRQEKLESLAQKARGCMDCKLSEQRNKVVFGEGNVRARVMVIGEGPGAREDEQGLPFVGPAGELLRGGFNKVGLEKDDIYITNTVKCRPPNNRDPREEELDACRSYLDRQLQLIEPDVILTLGNFALQYCLGPERRITASRGEVYNWEGFKLVPTFHPAYILRNRSDARKFFHDLKQVAVQLRE